MKMIIKSSFIRFTIVLLVLFISGGIIYGQGELQREVRVVKPYTPTLSDAQKISLTPEFNDTATFRSTFTYDITPKKYTTDFKVNPINPAKMIGLPLERLYKSQLTLGLGNYTTPYAELSVNTLRKRKSSMGLYFKHHSSSGKIKLPDDQKVEAPFSDNQVRLSGSRFFNKSAVEGEIKGGYNTFTYYGANPVYDTLIDPLDYKQKILQAGARLKYYSTHSDSSHLNYTLDAGYYYLQDDTDHSEQGIDLRGTLGKFIGDWYGNLDLRLESYIPGGDKDSADNTVIRVNPSLSKKKDQWRFVLGINTAIEQREGETNFYLYPRAEFEFDIIKNVLIPYMGITGDMNVSSYKKHLEHNPFVVPGLVAQNEDYMIAGYLGVKGSYSSKLAFDINTRYSRVENFHSYVSESLFDNAVNQFKVVYNDLDVFSAATELKWNYNNRLKFVLKGRYNKYLNVEKEIWHHPEFEAGLNTAYNLRDKILVSANLFYTGMRYARLDYADGSKTRMEMPGYFDGNLNIRYRYTKLLSFFANLNNFSASRYEEWYLFPVQRFQLMLGFSYAL